MNLSYNNWQVRFALKICVATLFAMTIALWLEIPNANWAAWVASIVMLPNMAASVKKASLRFIGTWVTFFISLFLYGMFFQNHIYFSIFYGLFIVYATYKRLLSDIAYFWWMLASVSIIVCLSTLGHPPTEAVYTATYRAIEISIGVLSAFIFNFWLWPNYIQEDLHKGSVALRKKYCLYIKEVFECYFTNSFNNETIKKHYTEINSNAKKLIDILHLTKLERKFKKLEHVSYDLNINELFFPAVNLLRFYKSARKNNTTYQFKYKKQFDDIIDNISSLIEILYEDNSEQKAKIIYKIDIKLDKINNLYENDINKENYSKKELVIFLESLINLRSFYFHLKNTIQNENKIYELDFKNTLIRKYTYYKTYSFLFIKFRIHSLAFILALKTGLCMIFSIWVIFAFQLPILEAGIMMLFAAMLYMKPSLTKNIKLGFFSILGSIASIAANLIFLTLFPDSIYFLYIFLFFVIFFFVYLRTSIPDLAIRYFCIWGLVGFLSVQISTLQPMDSLWPPLSAFTGSVLGVVIVYLFNNNLWKYNEYDDFIKKSISINNIFKDLYSNFTKYLTEEETYFKYNLGIHDITNQLINLNKQNKITNEQYNIYEDRLRLEKWIFFESKSTLIHNTDTFYYFYRLCPDFFHSIFKSITIICGNKPEYKTSLKLIDKLESNFTNLKTKLKNDEQRNQNIESKQHRSTALLNYRRIINLLENYIELPTINSKKSTKDNADWK
ncbi:MAG TPA: FUSC family protein [Victivallales bacterium]|nr:FUSC family protein [Victivallales bacterium]